MLKNKYRIETLPITDDFLREKRIIQDRGELVLLSDGDEIRHITFFTLNPGPERYRGGHYHKRHIETFYIVSGKVTVQLVDIASGEKEAIEMIQGNRMTVYPNCAHRFQAVNTAQVIEYYSKAYDPEDDIHFVHF